MVSGISGGTTEVAVIAMGGIVVSQSIRIAGDEFDQAILQHVRDAYHNLAIRRARTAEDIKVKGRFRPSRSRTELDVEGQRPRYGDHGPAKDRPHRGEGDPPRPQQAAGWDDQGRQGTPSTQPAGSCLRPHVLRHPAHGRRCHAPQFWTCACAMGQALRST